MLSSKRSYGTSDLARAVGQTPRTVRNFLRERFPAYEGKVWWKFSLQEYSALVEELKSPNSQRRYGAKRRHRRGRQKRG